MSFTPRKYKDIFDEMRAMTQVVTDFEVGSVARTMYESFAYEMALLYEKMQLVYLSAYVDTAQGNQLDQVVAVLGIQRSLPDYAEGIVSFQRDGAGQEIVIPIGTLVATEESSTGEKKVFQTIKIGTLGATRTSVDVQVRGVERGEELETAAETVIVMPRPVPGIKFVINDAPIRLVGKRRETDDELRERAKNALISSGKATILSIENALLSLSGVRDARVKENFHKARAKVEIRNINPIDKIIFKGTILKFNIPPNDFFFKVLDPVAYEIGEIAGTKKEIKIESILEGQIGEIRLTTGQSTVLAFAPGSPLISEFTANLLTDVKLEDFGLIEVYVDAPRMEDGTAAEIAAERSRIEAEIERVRAAGIFSILLPAGKVETSGVFKVDISPSLSLTAEERRDFEAKIEDEIVSYMVALRMGKPLLYGKLVKAILSLENIENLSDFRGTVTREVLDANLTIPFEFSDPDKFIAVDEFERIKPRHICVATEDKELKVHIAYESTNLAGVNAVTDANAVKIAMEVFFAGKGLGIAVTKTEIANVIHGPLALDPTTLDIRPETWCPGPPDDPRPLLIDVMGIPTVVVTYVEKAVLGTLFGYGHRLEIVGAIQLIMPLNVTNEEHIAAKDAVLMAIADLLDKLGPEEDATFEAMVTAAQTVPQVLAAKIDYKDFRAMLGSAVQPTQVDKIKIDVLPFQRAFPKFLCISSNIEEVKVRVTAVTVSMAALSLVAERDAVKTAVVNAYNNVLAGFKAGDDIVFATVKGALENLVVGVSYTITVLALEARSAGDGRTQVATIGAPTDFHIRSIELATVKPMLVTDITLTLP